MQNASKSLNTNFLKVFLLKKSKKWSKFESEVMTNLACVVNFANWLLDKNVTLSCCLSWWSVACVCESTWTCSVWSVSDPDTALQVLIERCVSAGSHYRCCDMKYLWPFSAAVELDVLPSLCTYCMYSLNVESHTANTYYTHIKTFKQTRLSKC